jgi:hypothetical protein
VVGVDHAMDVTLDPRASRLLALMHEADTEAVTLDELEIAGVEDPARALHALELAGFTFERVTDRTASSEEIQCVRLARTADAARTAATRTPEPTIEAAASPLEPTIEAAASPLEPTIEAAASPLEPAIDAAAPPLKPTIEAAASATDQPTVEWQAPAESTDPVPEATSGGSDTTVASNPPHAPRARTEPEVRAVQPPSDPAAPRAPRGSREAEAFAARAPRRTERIIEAADRRPLLLALVALVLVALLGHAAAGRRG